MPKAWYCIPSARPVAAVDKIVRAWRAQGYGVALWRDPGPEYPECDFLSVGEYPGYAMAVNALAAHVLDMDPECDWIVTGGDDTYPDPSKTAGEIAAEVSGHFHGILECTYPPSRPAWANRIPLGLKGGGVGCESYNYWATFGVMQPTGDPWSDSMGRIIERIAGSPWLGREWCRRANGGRGPLWPEFRHMFVDEFLQAQAQHLGVFVQRPDLIHFHDHAQRDQISEAPAHMAQWNSQEHWRESKAIFDRLKAGNFEECKPIA